MSGSSAHLSYGVMEDAGLISGLLTYRAVVCAQVQQTQRSCASVQHCISERSHNASVSNHRLTKAGVRLVHKSTFEMVVAKTMIYDTAIRLENLWPFGRVQTVSGD